MTDQPGLPKSVIFDLDNTLSLVGNRDPYDASTADKDTLNLPVAEALWCYQTAHPGIVTILLTGRPKRYWAPTTAFLTKHGIRHDHLYMREDNDRRSDHAYKLEVYETRIRGNYNVLAIYEDRLGPCRMWFEQGLPLFRVGDPESTF